MDENIENLISEDKLELDNLRPKDLDEFIGQKKVREQLTLLLTAAKKREMPSDHILLSGPPGLGKTSLAMIISKEMDAPLRITSGPALEKVGDIVSMLSNLIPGEILFIDEIHRISRPVEEMLYLAMEDFRVDVIVGKGPGATSIPLDLSPFTLVGATTRTGNLTSPLRDRFGFAAQMDFYSVEELSKIIIRSSNILNIDIDKNAALELATRSRGTPRIANRLLKRIRDFAQVKNLTRINMESTNKALEIYDVDSKGLDRLDREILTKIILNFNGGPVGLSTIAVAVGEDPKTVAEVSEPFLVREGFLARTPKGRIILQKALDHLNLSLK